MKSILLAGAGSVGKTMLLEALLRMAASRGLAVGTHRSTTRKSYAKAGLQSEGEQMQKIEAGDLDAMIEHQHIVMRDNGEELISASQRCYGQQCDLFVADRTPYDYATYFFSVFQPRLTLELIQQKRAEADSYVEGVLLRSAATDLVYFPFPAPWSQETVSSDGWRADKTPKNYIWSSLVAAELEEAHRRFQQTHWAGTPACPEFYRLNVFSEQGSPEVRAAALLSDLFPFMR